MREGFKLQNFAIEFLSFFTQKSYLLRSPLLAKLAISAVDNSALTLCVTKVMSYLTTDKFMCYNNGSK